MKLLEKIDRNNVKINKPGIDLDEQEDYFQIMKELKIIK